MERWCWTTIEWSKGCLPQRASLSSHSWHMQEINWTFEWGMVLFYLTYFNILSISHTGQYAGNIHPMKIYYIKELGMCSSFCEQIQIFFVLLLFCCCVKKAVHLKNMSYDAGIYLVYPFESFRLYHLMKIFVRLWTTRCCCWEIFCSFRCQKTNLKKHTNLIHI